MISGQPTNLIILAISFAIGAVAADSRTNFEVKRFEVCNNIQGVIKFRGNITKENGNQYLSFEMNSPVAWDDNLGSTCLIESVITEKNSVELFTIKEKNFCKAAGVYMGEFWYDIARAVGHPNPRSCPLNGGRFHVHHLQLDFEKVTLQTFPFGKLRFTIKAINNKHPEMNMWCILTEVENFLN